MKRRKHYDGECCFCGNESAFYKINRYCECRTDIIIAKFIKRFPEKNVTGLTRILRFKQFAMHSFSGSRPKKFKNKLPKTKKIPKDFYYSRKWRELRYRALKKYGRKCQCCGNGPPEMPIHVDHIKPRSKFPELELDINNLQVLCEDCNLGKSNKHCDDFGS